MSILKAIMHHYNATTKNYDTLHPETEAAQVTDWHSGIMASLASKTLGTVVDAVTTDSVLGKLIKLLLNASGVKYLIADNGYICFGSFFGGVILQWGTTGKIVDDRFPQWIYPIAVSEVCKIFTNEAYPTSWLESQEISASSAAENSVGPVTANIVTAHVQKGGNIIFSAATTNCFMIGRI